MPQSPWKTHLLPPWCPRLNPAFFLKGETNTIWKIYLKLKIEKILICLVSMSNQLITFNFSTFPSWHVSWELNLNVFWVTTFILNSLKKDKSFKNNINPISHFVPVPFIAHTRRLIMSIHHITLVKCNKWVVLTLIIWRIMHSARSVIKATYRLIFCNYRWCTNCALRPNLRFSYRWLLNMNMTSEHPQMWHYSTILTIMSSFNRHIFDLKPLKVSIGEFDSGLDSIKPH